MYPEIIQVCKEIINNESISTSPSGRYTVFFKESPPDLKRNLPSEQKIEVWSNQKRMCVISAKETHAKVCADPIFQNISWNDDETNILYVAESLSERKKYWDKNEKKQEYGYYEFREDYGELMKDLFLPRIFELSIPDQKIKNFEKIPSHLALGHPSYSPNGVIFIAYDTNKRKLGLKYCIQRENKIYHLLDDDLTQIVETEWNIHFPRFSKDKKKLLYFTTG